MNEKRIKISKLTKADKNKQKIAAQREKELNPYGMISNFSFIVKEAWRINKPLIFVSAVLVIVEVLYNVFNVYFNKYVVETALLSDNVINNIVFAISFFVLMGVCAIATRAGNLYLNNKGKFKMSHHFGMLLRNKMMNTDYQNLEKTHVTDMFEKANSSAGWVSTSALGAIKGTLSHVFQLVSFGAILSMLSPLMILIVAVPTVVGYYINRHKMRWIWQKQDEWTVYDRQIRYAVNNMHDFDRAKDVRVFSMQNWLTKRFDRIFESRLDWWRQQDKWESIWEIAEEFFSVALGDLVAYIYIIYLVVNGDIGAGDFVLYFNSILHFARAVRGWCDNYSAYKWFSNNIAFLRNYLNLEEKTNRGKGASLPENDYEIEFRNVSYTYYGTEKPTISNISFKLHKDEKLALVGLNGAGKTTLIKLMCGLYDPTEGEILLNGVNIKEYNREEYFNVFSAVFQDITELPVSIAQNITQSVSEDYDTEKVNYVLKQAGLYDKVQELPQKEKTRLVKSVYEDATEFSGGQKQKLALARALYKDAPVLLLDEPTAALDPIAEQEMYLKYADFTAGKSSVFISHRLASTRFCDHIILLDNGGIAEYGTHNELMNKDGKYAELFKLQSSYYTKGGEENV